VERSEKLSGAWNIAHAEELRAQFAAMVEMGGEIVLDLSAVESCDAAALQLLCSLRRTAAERGLRLRLVDSSPAIVETAQALGLAFTEITGEVTGGV